MTETQTVIEKRKPGRPPKVAAEPEPIAAPDLLKGRKRRQIEVIERRLKGDPFARAQGPDIYLKDRSMRIRWFNNEIAQDKSFRAEHSGGYIKVHKDDVSNPEILGAYTVTLEGYIVRGPRGQEICMQIPKAAFDAIAAAKSAKNLEGMQSATKQREKLQETVAAAGFGGQLVEKTGTVEIKDWKGPSDGAA